MFNMYISAVGEVVWMLMDYYLSYFHITSYIKLTIAFKKMRDTTCLFWLTSTLTFGENISAHGCNNESTTKCKLVFNNAAADTSAD